MLFLIFLYFQTLRLEERTTEKVLNIPCRKSQMMLLRGTVYSPSSHASNLWTFLQRTQVDKNFKETCQENARLTGVRDKGEGNSSGIRFLNDNIPALFVYQLKKLGGGEWGDVEV